MSPHRLHIAAVIRRKNVADIHFKATHKASTRSLRNNTSLFTVREKLTTAVLQGRRVPTIKKKKKKVTVFPFVCQEWLLPGSRQLVDISSSVRPNSLLAQTPTSCAKWSCSCLDCLQNKYAAQPKEKFLLFCSRHRVHGPAWALFYTSEL